MNDPVTQYRLYTDGTVVQQDDFADYDNTIPFYEEYKYAAVLPSHRMVS